MGDSKIWLCSISTWIWIILPTLALAFLSLQLSCFPRTFDFSVLSVQKMCCSLSPSFYLSLLKYCGPASRAFISLFELISTFGILTHGSGHNKNNTLATTCGESNHSVDIAGGIANQKTSGSKIVSNCRSNSSASVQPIRCPSWQTDTWLPLSSFHFLKAPGGHQEKCPQTPCWEPLIYIRLLTLTVSI